MEKSQENINNKKTKFEIWKIIITIFITAVITFFFTYNFVLRAYLNTSGMTYLTTKLGIVKQKLNSMYIYDMNEEKMIENAIKGYVSGIGDKYTEYLSKEEMDDLLESTSGNYVGIGVYLGNNTEDNTVLIVGVIKDSVAAEAGLEAGDVIKSIDGVEYTGEELNEASSALKDKEEGTEVKITVIRDSEELNFTLKRSNIRLKAVDSEIKDGNIGYIRISTFNEGTANEFKEAYKKIKEQGATSLIIDLRNNGGGLVSESLKIADTMVPKGKTMLITSNKESKEKIEKANQNPSVDMPVVILINENTASASEILAGCLKDNCNYKIFGVTSYGKGVIQTVYKFADGSGLKVTTEEYFTPNHNKINKVGIKPDENIELDDEWQNKSIIPEENDKQLEKALEYFKK